MISNPKRPRSAEPEPPKRDLKRNKPLSDFCSRQGAMETIKSLGRVVALRKHFPIGKQHTLKCVSCGATSGRLHACVESNVVACWSRGHLQSYLTATGHELAMDLDRGIFYSHTTKDYVYDSEIDKAMVLENCVVQSEALGNKQVNNQELPLLLEHSSLQSIRADKSICERYHGVWGLRGMNNLGNTCFMSCVMQAFSSNPFLRGAAMSHTDAEDSQVKKDAPDSEESTTLNLGSAILDTITQLHNGSAAAFSPHNMLLSLWRSVDSLKGYKQQDAHEFFIAAVNALSSAQHRGANYNLTQKVFGGVLQSTVVCSQCSRKSDRSEPFNDISLDVGGRSEIQTSLTDCLDQFISPEHLQQDEQTFCPNCNSKTDCTKQLSIKSAPSVLCIHFKRFKRSQALEATTKIDQQVNFPLDGLDIAPYCTVESTLTPPLNYDLFALVEHKGTMDTGHYIAYVRKVGDWFRCDDSWVASVCDSTVREAQGYMLFYCKRGVDAHSSLPDTTPGPHTNTA